MDKIRCCEFAYEYSIRNVDKVVYVYKVTGSKESYQYTRSGKRPKSEILGAFQDGSIYGVRYRMLSDAEMLERNEARE